MDGHLARRATPRSSFSKPFRLLESRSRSAYFSDVSVTFYDDSSEVISLPFYKRPQTER